MGMVGFFGELEQVDGVVVCVVVDMVVVVVFMLQYGVVFQFYQGFYQDLVIVWEEVDFVWEGFQYVVGEQWDMFGGQVVEGEFDVVLVDGGVDLVQY